MANGSLLQAIANPQIANLPGQFAAGQQSSLQNRLLQSKLAEQEQGTQLRGALSESVGTPQFQSNLRQFAVAQPQAAQNIQQVFAGISEENLRNAFTNIQLASTAPIQDQNIRLEAAKEAFEGRPEFQQALTSLQNATPEQRVEMFKRMTQVGQQLGVLKELKQAPGGTPSPLLKMIAEKQAFVDAGFALDSPEVKAFDRKLLGAPGDAWPRMAKLMAQGYMPAQRVTGPLMDALEAAAAKAEELGTPYTPQKMRDFEFEAVRSRATGRTAGGRLTIARKQNIKAAVGLLKDMKTTAHKLNYSDFQLVGVLQKWKKGQLNDPIFTEYMTQRSDALFALGAALKQSGVTDKSIEVEEEAARPTMSGKAFDAWHNTQMRALQRASEEMAEDFKFEFEEIETVPPGRGGRPLPELTEPTPRAVVAPQAALDALSANPNMIDQFVAKYGYRPEGF
jgi:hypothetical protein